jgi:outer membrane protein assembly factor BamB
MGHGRLGGCLSLALGGVLLVATGSPGWASTERVARWPQFQGTAAHRGENPLERRLTAQSVTGLALSWVGQVPGDLDWASPVVSQGSVYITGGDAGLVVFPESGCGAGTCQPSWTGRTGPQAIAAPAVMGGLVYVASQASRTSNDGRLNVFAAAGCGQPTCDPLWRGIGGTESFLISSPAVASGVVYVGSFDGTLFAFGAAGCGASICEPLWTGSTGGPIDSSPAVAGGLVFVGTTDGSLYAFPAAGCRSATCSPLWRGLTGGSIDIASPTVADGVVLVGNGDAIVAFDASGCGAPTCQPLWTGPAELTSNAPAVSRGVVYVDAQPILQGGQSIGVVEAFPLHGCGSPICEPVWSGINFATGAESSPVVANGVLYIGKGPASGFPVDSGVYAFDARGCGAAICEPLAFVQAGPQQFYLSSTPAVVNGRVFMGSTETSSDQAGLYAFELPAVGD